MRLVQADETKKELTEQIKVLYRKAFPKEERKPYTLIEEKQREGKMQIWAIVEDDCNKIKMRKEETNFNKGNDNTEKIVKEEVLEDGIEFCGLAITILDQDLVLLDYFAICQEKRGHGIGSKVLEMLKEKYKDRILFLEIESTKERSEKLSEKEKQIRNRRKQFYYRNGMKDTGLEAILFGVPMEILSFGKKLDWEEYLGVYVNTFGEKVKGRIEYVESLY